MNPAALILAALPPDRARGVVLIDGGAGSGKTTLAGELAQAWPGPLQVVSLDDLYPGWSGLAAGSAAVAEQLLRPSTPGYRRWDWGRSGPAEWVPIDPSVPLLIEGCGALTPRNRGLADLGVWCELDETERHRRAIARDGEAFAVHWEEWEEQEAEHWRRHRPWELADLVVTVGQGRPG